MEDERHILNSEISPVKHPDLIPVEISRIPRLVFLLADIRRVANFVGNCRIPEINVFLIKFAKTDNSLYEKLNYERGKNHRNQEKHIRG